jgi:glycosyltransferase involved in cell wall biosynthesis
MAADVAPRILLVHNRYRIEGGEERSLELHARALRDAGVEHAVFERSSSEAGRGRAAVAMLRGGEHEHELAAAARELGAGVVHAHNMQPLVGPRGLAAARATGAAVVLHLHNARLFCAIGVASRDGGPCFRCHHRFTLPGLVLNCRDSVPESAVYTAALARQQPEVFETVDRFVAPSRYAAGQLALLGLPADRTEVIPHYLPAESVADESGADRGGYALIAARLSEEKGIDVAIRAAADAGVPLRIAGEGPEEGALRALAEELRAPVQFVGRVPRAEMPGLLAGAAMVLLPSRYHEFAPYSALEAMAAGVPVVASALGGLPEILGGERCVAPNDPAGLAARMRELHDDANLRRREGDALLARVRENHSEERFTGALLELYSRLTPG